MKNVTFPIGNVAIIDKVNVELNFFDFLLGGVGGRAKHLKETAKLLVSNRLDKCVSINRLLDIYPEEMFRKLGFDSLPGKRSIYRNLERIGERYQIIMGKYQQFIKKHGLVSKEQFLDFSSSYFEGKKAEMSALGYSRDHRPGKKQITFGMGTGINNIPSALTIQKGNTNDKKHFNSLLRITSKVLPKDSLVIFDCGANTKKNKEKVVKKGLNYLTLKAKHRGSYEPYIKMFNDAKKEEVEFNGLSYKYVKIVEDGEVKYIFFSQKLYEDQIKKKEKRYKKELEKITRNHVRSRKVRSWENIFARKDT